ncbi:hypothetical protein EDD63_11243 [Breznakia blatticola]|uniref:Ig-like domain-containing protein n=1 Tax=Breznakia blatticola TaxID=1754012 RepID=A0A4R7ZRI0_9FIRM|nr:hypothetical protein [Breznakia blatticola]TDW20577.1 hypothetical protein EDD63_11243 [Breznakia blatticola]
MQKKKNLKMRFFSYALMVTIIGSLSINAFFSYDLQNHQILMKQEEQDEKLDHEEKQIEEQTNDSIENVKVGTDNLIQPRAVTSVVIDVDEQPEGADYLINETAQPLRASGSIEGKPTATKNISYSWQVNDSLDNTGWSYIDGAKGKTFTPPTNVVGTKYYRLFMAYSSPIEGMFAGVSRAVPIVVHDKAKQPSITTQPVGATYRQGDTVTPLKVTARKSDEGTLTYQWYSTSVKGNVGGVLIQGATKSTYTPPLDNIETRYYYVVVTNTGYKNTKAKSTSNPAAIEVKKAIVPPKITEQPRDWILPQSPTTKIRLNVKVEAPEGAKLTYQWYKNADKPEYGGTLASVVSSNSLSVSTDKLGKAYYYVEVTSNDGGDISIVRSNIVYVDIRDIEELTIATHPDSAEYQQNEDANALKVTTNKIEYGTVTYQWYKNTTDATGGSTQIPGATKSTYTPPTSELGRTFYFVRVRNTWGSNVKEKWSRIANVNVLPNAQEPIISKQPITIEWIEDGTPAEFSVEATSPDKGTLSYQWYLYDSKTGGTGRLINGATKSTFTPKDVTVGSKYYGVTVTNTLNNSSKSVESERAVARIVSRAEIPTITEQPADVIYGQGAKAEPLKVVAEVSDGGTLKYQWFSRSGAYNTIKNPISGQTMDQFIPDTSTIGYKYYHVDVYNYSGQSYKTSRSRVVKVQVVPAANAPTINEQPNDATYGKHAEADKLSVTATSDTGVLSYQWYENSTKSNTGGNEIFGATNKDYRPSTGSLGKKYYYVKVTNTVHGTSKSTVSNAAEIEIVSAAETPKITKHPDSAIYGKGAKADFLSVEASVNDTGTLSCQWYQSTSENGNNALEINDATASTYKPRTFTTGKLYYFVEVTNTKHKTTRVSRSKIASIEVVEAAKKPIIENQPEGDIYEINEQANTLHVDARKDGDGTLSYQWYEFETFNSDTKHPIEGETTDSYTPSTTTLGEKAYCVVITNTLHGTTASVESERVEIKVFEPTGIPTITENPKSAIYGQKAKAKTLRVSAIAKAGGTLSYQWYQNDQPTIDGATAIDQETSTTYTPSTETLGHTYYFAIVTNTENDISKEATSEIADIEVIAPATKPTINVKPQNAIYGKGATAKPLEVDASASDGGILTYKWFKISSKKTGVGKSIDDATNSVYTPSTDVVETAYYYVEVTNTLHGTSAVSESDRIRIDIVNAAAKPDITGQPKDSIYGKGAAANKLVVEASSSDTGTLSYQWYQSANKDGSNAKAIKDATNDTYAPSTNTLGKNYYYVEVTNTLYGTTAKNQSNIAEIEVIAAADTLTITKSPDDNTYGQGAKADPLSVDVDKNDNGTLSYQWFASDDRYKTNVELVQGATKPTYTPSTDEVGLTYYYVEVTNTLYGTTSSVTSDVAKIEVVPAAQAVSIEKDPESAIYGQGAHATDLVVEVRPNDTGSITYQWFKSNKKDLSDATSIEDATTDSYMPSTKDIGTSYYYVEITNTLYGTTAKVVSETAKIEVVEKAVKPTIDTQPESAYYLTGSDATALEVEGSASNGVLSYQWYESENDEVAYGQAIQDATEVTYTPDTSVEDTRYYYVVVTNTEHGTTASQTSDIATITVVDEPETPTINEQLQDATYIINDEPEMLFVDAEVSDDGVLSYQWYVSKTKELEDATLIENETEEAYLPSTDEKGIFYYWVQITNTRKGETRHITSEAAMVQVIQPAATPIIHKHPEHGTYIQDETPLALHVQATVEDDGQLTYQWYEQTSEEHEDILIDDATAHTFTPDTTAIGSTSYYVVITNTLDDQTSQVTSEVATIQVKKQPEPTIDPEEGELPPIDEIDLTDSLDNENTVNKTDGLEPSTPANDGTDANVSATQDTHINIANNQHADKKGVTNTNDEVKNTKNDQHHKQKSANTNKDILTTSDNHNGWSLTSYILMAAGFLSLFGLFFLLIFLWKRKKDDEEDSEQTANER